MKDIHQEMDIGEFKWQQLVSYTTTSQPPNPGSSPGLAENATVYKKSPYSSKSNPTSLPITALVLLLLPATTTTTTHLHSLKW